MSAHLLVKKMENLCAIVGKIPDMPGAVLVEAILLGFNLTGLIQFFERVQR